MVNIIAFNDFAATGRGADGSEVRCWICQKPTHPRSLFCAHCGAVQPVQDMDHFTRLGLERRIDIDSELLEKQFVTFEKLLDPVRFSLRGLGERSHAADQLKAITEAFITLRDPLARGRYWLSLHEKDVDEAEAINPLLQTLRAELQATEDVADCDRIAQKAGQALEHGIMSLMQSLRGQNWQHANAMLVELDGLEALLADVRTHRSDLTIVGVKEAGAASDGSTPETT